MKFFLDTASLDELREAAAMGLIDGVTTNPTLVAKEGRPFRELLEEICSIVDGPISAEVLGGDAAAMLAEAKTYSAVHKNVVIKCPLSPEGLKATKVLSGDGVPVNVTLCFTPAQALLAAKAGAAYVSPFIGRLDDVSQHGMGLIADILTIFDNYMFETEILVASVRHPLHVVEAAKLGADVVTMPTRVFHQLFRHPLTDRGMELFARDWERVPG